MKKIEIVGKRKPREKHFLQEDGTFKAFLYDEDVHFLKNGKYEEIDNKLSLINDYYVNKNNSYNVYFSSKTNSNIMNIVKQKKYLNVYIKDYNNYTININNDGNKIYSMIEYKNVFNNIDINYHISSTKIKENIVINNRNINSSKLHFYLRTNLILEVNNDGNVIAKDEKNKEIFVIDKPYLIDTLGNKNYNCNYDLIKDENEYELILNIDINWIKNNNNYPIIIDPTISNVTDGNNVYDTYIFPNDTNIDRNAEDKLKVGVERNNNVDVINRALLKFDLPQLGTGSHVISAKLNLINYAYITTIDVFDVIDIHRITTDWLESTATWATMHDKYDSSRVEGVINYWGVAYYQDQTEANISTADITTLVQKWYTDTDNNGIMLKLNKEVYKEPIVPTFYSKSTTNSELRPLLTIVYKNYNGLENYLNYETQKFINGEVYHNTYTGNLVSSFDIGATHGGKLNIKLKLIRNTNDVVLNRDTGLGVGYKLNYYQTVKSVSINNTNYLEYMDADGTIHYFTNKKQEYINGEVTVTTYTDRYFDEDGLDFEIQVQNDKYILKTKNGISMNFIKYNDVGYLNKIIDSDNNEINIYHNYDYSKITFLIDANNQSIDLLMNNNGDIRVISPGKEVLICYYGSSLPTAITYKTGYTNFTYDSNGLITDIFDVNGKRISYEYYENSPYKLKKVTEYGLNNEIGNFYNVTYDLNTTTIYDDNHRRILTYNPDGNLASDVILDNNDNIKNGYGSRISYGKEVPNTLAKTNKLLSETIPIKSVNNLIINGNFDNNDNIFTTNDNVNLVITDEICNIGLKCLKVTSLENNTSITKSFSVNSEKYYTFSAFFKTINKPINLSIEYTNSQNEIVSEIEENIISNNEFERHDVTIYYPGNALSDLIVKISMAESGVYYVDNLQLEESETVNNYNLIENSDFKNGLNDWTLYVDPGYQINDIFSVVNIDNNQKALKVNMITSNSSSFQKTFNIKGKMGDKYTLSFWFKNKGLSGGITELGDGTKNNVTVIFFPEDETIGGDSWIDSFTLNPNETDWQFFTCEFTAFYDFKNFVLIFEQSYNANDFYITNISLFKDVKSINYDYDENGNIIRCNTLEDKNIFYSYNKDNELIKIIDPEGYIVSYEYDNNDTTRLLRGVSQKSISNELEYNQVGNIKYSRIINRKQLITPENGLYYIRIKGTNKIININKNNLILTDDYHAHNNWIMTKVVINDKDYYKFEHSIIHNKFLLANNESITLDEYNQTQSLFELIKQDNGSFHIKAYNDKYLKSNNNGILLSDLVDGDNTFEFYFEKSESKIFIENGVKYDSENKYINETIDPLLNKTSYYINPISGLLYDVKTNNESTDYEYYTSEKIKSMTNGNKKITYEYNNQQMISKLKQGTKEYNFEYDNFLNLSKIKIGNKELVNNIYDSNNGNLIDAYFGNNHTQFEYDEFNRIIKETINDKEYNYRYGGNGDLLKVFSNNEKIKFIYDLSRHLSEYRYNNFKIKYGYNSNNDVVSKKIILDSLEHEINNNISDDMLLSTAFDSNIINYNYDVIGRLINKQCGNNLNITYSYYDNGYRCSLLIKELSNNNDKYKYNYNKNNNITHIYHNNVLENKYYYDTNNQLIREDNYLDNITIRYNYDCNGNIRYVKEYKINTYDLLNQQKFVYNDANWPDLLTSYNGEQIIYDSIGNPIQIGNNKYLTWEGGKNLIAYVDNNLNVNYTYNYNGIRTSKTVNNITTNYYVEDGHILYEEKNNNIIWYLRNNVDNIIGFVYNNNTYYYLKNGQDDIIAITDSNGQIVAKYKYDSWGNIISITNGSNEDVSNIPTHIANINPFRYKGYYYDIETELYYLNSRYYNPKWCRFISPDSIISPETMNYNLYSYCENDPINNCDSTGNLFEKTKKFLSNLFKTVTKKIQSVVKKMIKSNTKVVDKTTVYSVGIPQILGTVSSGTYTESTIKTYNKNKSDLLQYNINLSTSLSDLSHGISTKGLLGEASTNTGLFGHEVTYKANNGNYLSFGRDLFEVSFAWGHEEEIDGKTVEGDFTRIDLNAAIFAFAVAYAIEYVPAIAKAVWTGVRNGATPIGIPRLGPALKQLINVY